MKRKGFVVVVALADSVTRSVLRLWAKSMGLSLLTAKGEEAHLKSPHLERKAR